MLFMKAAHVVGGLRRHIVVPDTNECGDDVQPTLVHDRGDWLSREGVDAAPEEWKTRIGEIWHWRREVEFALKPRLHGVPIRRAYVDEVLGDQRVDVPGHHLFRDHRRVVQPRP